MNKVRYLPGNGSEYLIDVNYISYDFARDADSKCAFCHGDPCPNMMVTITLPAFANFDSTSFTMIQKYYFDCAAGGFLKPSTCPMCKGAPS